MAVVISKHVDIKGSMSGGTVKVRSSKNLRCIMEHNRATRSKPVAYICTAQTDNGYCVGFEYPNGDFGNVYFASLSIAIEWFTKRASKVTLI